METVINPAITGVIMSDEAYTSRPGSTLSLCFPRLLICLPLVCSFLPSSITLETLLLLVGKISGLKPDHQGQHESLSRSRRKRTSFVFDFSNTEESWPYGNSRTPKCPCTAITSVPSLLSDVPVWKALTFIFSRSMSWSILRHEGIQYQLNSVKPKPRVHKSTCPSWIVGLTSGMPSSEHRHR